MSDSKISETPSKPIPQPTALSAPHWEGAKQGRLLLQRCASCGKVRHYPQYLCPSCHAFDVEWIDAARRGRIHSWTVSHHAFHAAFADEVPYTLATIELDEGVRVMARYRGTEPIKIDLPVKLHFEDDAQGTPGLVAEPAQS